MKEKNEHIIQLKCICHSLNLRKSEYRRLFTSMNPDSETTRMPLDEYSQTRWLARGKVLFFKKNLSKNINKSL